MPDVTYAFIDEMEPIFEGVARRARAELGVTAWGMQVLTLPPDWGGYPNHNHDETTEEAGQEEVYIPLAGSATLVAGTERYDLRPGVMVRVGSDERRQILLGEDGIRFVALGGVPGVHEPSPWTQLGGPLPAPSTRAARSLLQAARLAARRRRRAAGDALARLARTASVPAARPTGGVAPPHRDQRRAPHDRAAP